MTEDGTSEPTIQLLIAHEKDRQLLARELSSSYAVTTAMPEDIAAASFDACIVGPRSFERHEAAITADKQRTEPVFLPYVFLSRETPTADVPGRVWSAVDEVLSSPVDPAELQTRLENLLERRRLSLDLTRRKERSEQRFKTLFETAPDPVVVTTSDGVISEVNDAFAGTLNRTRSELAGTSITDLEPIPENAVERVLLRIDDSEVTPGQDTAAVEIDRTEADPLIMELNADIVTTVGKAGERIGIFRDVTERERRETSLREENERLEEFASTIAHDLRNPLSVARARLNLARDGTRDDLDAVAQAHDRMEQLIDEILTLARQGQQVSDPERLSVDTVAEHAWQTVETGNAKLTAESEVTLVADRGRLCECFENLFRNAVEHGGQRPSVAVGGLTDGFYVADDGPGIPPADQEAVFQSGYSTDAQGTGFGLSIVRQIVEGHGWTITVADGEREGARFEVSDATVVNG